MRFLDLDAPPLAPSEYLEATFDRDEYLDDLEDTLASCWTDGKSEVPFIKYPELRIEYGDAETVWEYGAGMDAEVKLMRALLTAKDDAAALAALKAYRAWSSKHYFDSRSDDLARLAQGLPL